MSAYPNLSLNMLDRRVLLSVGCDTYTASNLSNLLGAENDAQQIYTCLTDPNVGNYSKSLSKLLLSPTLEQFTDTIKEVLFTEEGIEVLTIFFAGHGGPKNGSYYFCFADTDTAKMSMSAYPLNSLFTVLNECQPAQINIIIDSCQAGSLVGDLSILLKPESSGSNKSPCISLLAAASSNEFANEINGNGVVTKLILEYLNGEKKLNTTSTHLDLTEIGRGITTKIEKEYNQTPIVYGLSLHGFSKFCKNPYFNSKIKSSNPETLQQISTDSELGRKINKYTEAIWMEYRATETEPNAERLANLLRKILKDIDEDPDGIATFILSISNSFEQQASESNDTFGAVTIISTFLVIIQKFITNQNVEKAALYLLSRRKTLLIELVKSISSGLKGDEFYLLNKQSSSADLFYLPIRITKVLGVLWSQILINSYTSETDILFNDMVNEVTEHILEHYKDSIVSISDKQAPYIYVIAKASKGTKYQENISILLHLYIEDLFTRKGNVADVGIQNNEVLAFLLNRNSKTERAAPELLANPSQLLSVYMLLAKDFVNVESFDSVLKTLDHQSMVIFIPDTYTSYSDQIIRDGVNNCFKVGHGIWSIEDFEREFKIECFPLINEKVPTTPTLIISSIISSLIFPDRIPWFLEV